MTLAIAAAVALIAAAIQRVTGLGFALVVVGPFVVLFGALEGVTLVILLSVVAAALAIPFVWRDIEWRRAWGLIWPGLIAAPFAAFLVTVLPAAALELGVAAVAALALAAGSTRAVTGALTGRAGMWAAGGLAGFLHTAGGLSGPPLAAYGTGTRWEQRGFVATLQVIFAVFSTASILLRGLPATPVESVALSAAATVLGIAIGSWATRHVPVHIARRVMLVLAWCGAGLVAVRGILTLVS